MIGWIEDLPWLFWVQKWVHKWVQGFKLLRGWLFLEETWLDPPVFQYTSKLNMMEKKCGSQLAVSASPNFFTVKIPQKDLWSVTYIQVVYKQNLLCILFTQRLSSRKTPSCEVSTLFSSEFTIQKNTMLHSPWNTGWLRTESLFHGSLSKPR